MPKRLSYSSLSTYSECGQRWLLERGYGLGRGTWFATVAGSAIHNITEKMDLAEIGLHDGPIPTFAEEFDRLLYIENSNDVEVKPSGRKLTKIGPTGGPNKKDYAWWLEYGPLYVRHWEMWKADSNLILATMPDGSPGVEVSITQPMGGKTYLGFIDRVFITPGGEVIVVDLKSGSIPSSTLQLGSYRIGLAREHGLYADWGAYWMASTGELTHLHDLTRYTDEYVDSMYAMAWRGIEAGVFLPNVTSMCSGCGVRAHCRAVGGSDAWALPVSSTLVSSTAGEETSSIPPV
jgi:hypothetical protein